MISGRSIVVGIAFGVTLYYLLSNVLGFAAALAFPSWYVPFALENKIASLVIWSLVTSVPLIVIVSVALGWALSRLVTGHFVAVGLIAVFFSMFVSFAGSASDLGIVLSLWVAFIPNHWIGVPTYVAMYCSLPAAAWYLGRRGNAA